MSDKQLTICLDPGHGPGTVNGSPDGTYKETEFAWDMHLRIKVLLEGCGVNVIVTRQEGVKPSLTARAETSNKAGADLFVSLHSNAAPAVDSDGWSPASGLLIYTSQAGDTAGRNKAAKAVLKRVAEAGVKLQGAGLSHYGYTVLTETVAPAILIEYGFHTNKEDVERLKDPAYREQLAMATAQGICDYLGVEWQMGGEDPAPWYEEARQWAVDMGITDGTRPEELCTRAEVWEMLKRYTEALSGAGEER